MFVENALKTRGHVCEAFTEFSNDLSDGVVIVKIPHVDQKLRFLVIVYLCAKFQLNASFAAMLFSCGQSTRRRIKKK